MNGLKNLDINACLRHTQGDSALLSLSLPHPHITRDKMKIARLAISQIFSFTTLQKNFGYA